MIILFSTFFKRSFEFAIHIFISIFESFFSK
nr:MAG TPA: hypothetical protein [Caudoviricetes sp.]